jgi:hypothetical protein
MGCMSASDAAPLPRLGEVFFDIRGSSRSMRLSWYADTGVAVFSIWQGGMCTGTFRLAIGDLPRMVETLQRGPGGQQPGPDDAVWGDGEAGGIPLDSTAQVPGMGPLAGDELPGYEPGPPGYAPGPYPDHQAEQADYRGRAAEYPAGRPGPLTGSAPYPARAADHPVGYGASNGHLAGAGPSAYADPPPASPSPFTDRPPDSPYPDRSPGASYPAGGSDLPYAGARPEVPYPGRPDPSYPGTRPEPPYRDPGATAPYPGARPDSPYAGPSDASYPGARPDAPYPASPDLFHTGADGGAHSRGAGGPGGRFTDDPYPGSRSRGDADYPPHYGADDADDPAPSPPPESFPYGHPPGNRGPGGRHADRGAPFD